MPALDFTEVKEHLNITKDDSDDELASVIYAAEAAVAVRVGPLEPETRTARVDGFRQVLLLPTAPVVSLMAVATSTNVTVDTSTLTLDPDAGTLEYTDGSRFTASKYVVTYEAGWDELPDDLVFATKELVRHLWSTQRGASQRPGSAVQEPQGPGFALPNRVSELLAPYMSPRVA
jgi:hypothetical protein